MIIRELGRCRTNWATLGLTVVIGFCAGCGDGRPERVPVAGRVLIDGQPLEQGNIRVHPPGDRAATGKLGTGGQFTLSTYELGDGCVIGNHPVSINAMEVVDSTTLRWHTPKGYREPATSGVTINVSEPTNDLEIQLTWNGGKPFTERVAGGGD